LSTPQPYSTKGDIVTDRIYAGDLKGNMWAFDVSNTNPANWKVAYGTSVSPKPLFTATHHAAVTAGGIPVQESPIKVQPITSRPAIVKNKQAAGNAPNVLVLFGTGQYLVGADPNTTDIQTFYGVWDHGFSAMSPAYLVEQTFLAGPFYNNTGILVTDDVRALSKNPVTYSQTVSVLTSKQGWMINLTKAAKERLVVDPDVVDEKNLFFNTWIPSANTAANADDLCSTGGSADGYGFLMTVDLFTGSSTVNPAIDTNANGAIGADDLVASTSTVGASTQQYIVAGQKFPQGLPASSTFFNNQQYTPGTDASVPIGGATSDAVIAAINAAQAVVNAAQAASDAANAALAAARADKIAAQIAYNSASSAADAAAALANADPTNATLAQAAADAAAAAAAAADANDSAAQALADAATAAKKAKKDLANANKLLGIAQTSAIKNLNQKAPMSRISWEELRSS
jgi:hypothetical protein